MDGETQDAGRRTEETPARPLPADAPSGAVAVAGCVRWVLLRASFPAREFFTLPRAVMRGIGQLPFDEQVGAVMRVVEAWGLAADPHELASWEQLDALADLLPLWNAITEHLSEVIARRNADLKN